MSGDSGLAANIEPGRILQHDITVGIEITQNLRGVGVGNIVPDNGGAAGLEESGRLAQTDIKALPVNKSVIGGLNRKLGTVARKCGAALGYSRADGIGPARPKEKAARQRG